ncbi:hypothetical protein UFOVP872_2 [uncultured Caudovirales phage]|uniref:Uncharacterized protein n=1 Tax=uncultured Caudovirales phage TaxID=2100421 RepID=A0A6J5P7W7_9CAUD|nr:hypothetical protein UFOVP872_2 [uncultured Caudovirales phage]
MAFDMTDYVDVKHRLQLALLKYPTLRIVEDAPELIHLGERIYIQCAVTVFRDETDALPMRAYCWEVWPGRTPFTKDSEQMNGATSALGRALGYMGFGITTGLASADEVRTAQGNQHPSTQEPAPAEPAAPTKRVYSTYAQTQMDRKPEHSAPRGLATPAQIKLIETMSSERSIDPPETNGMTYAAATEYITHLKGIPRK